MKTLALSAAALSLAFIGAPVSAQPGAGTDDGRSLGLAAASSGAPAQPAVAGSTAPAAVPQRPANDPVADTAPNLKRATRKSRRDLVEEVSQPTATVQAQGKAKTRGKAKSGGGN